MGRPVTWVTLWTTTLPGAYPTGLQRSVGNFVCLGAGPIREGGSLDTERSSTKILDSTEVTDLHPTTTVTVSRYDKVIHAKEVVGATTTTSSSSTTFSVLSAPVHPLKAVPAPRLFSTEET